MSKIKLTGENSGYVEISAGQNAGNNTLETPTSGTRLVAHEGSQDVTLNANLTVNGVLTYDDVTNIDSVGVVTARNGLHVTGGSVGIGTDAPAAGNKLHLHDTSACRIQLTTDSTGHTLSDGTRLMVDSSNNFEILNRENANIEFFTNNTERLRITSAGQVNINAFSESLGGKVVIKHNVNYNTTDFDDDPTLYLLNGDQTTGVSEAAIVLAGRNTAGSTYRAAISGNGSTGLKFYTTSNTELDDTPAMLINGSGNIGIGIDNPTQKLVVKGVSSLMATNSTNAWMPYTYTDNSFRLNYNGAGDDEVTVTSGGNMSLGTSTGLDFSLLDGLVINTTNGNAGVLINSSSSSHNAYLGFSYGSGSSTSHADQFSAYIGRVGDNKLILGTNNTIRLNIDSSGRIGIQGDPTRALLEVRASGGSNTMLTALWGANEGTTTGALSDNTDKAVRMGIQHYDTDALPYAFLVGSSTNNANNLTFGGGTSLMNAATEIVFRTASNTTTTTGTERLRINSAGQMILGTATNLGSVPPKLTIVNDTNSSNFSECQLIRLNGPGAVGERGGIGFHYANSLNYGEKPSSFIGVETVATGGAQETDLLFATRPNTNDVEPTERLRITSDGRIGIGTDNPDQAVEINGSVKFTRGTSTEGSQMLVLPLEDITLAGNASASIPVGSRFTGIIIVAGYTNDTPGGVWAVASASSYALDAVTNVILNNHPASNISNLTITSPSHGGTHQFQLNQTGSSTKTYKVFAMGIYG